MSVLVDNIEPISEDALRILEVKMADDNTILGIIHKIESWAEVNFPRLTPTQKVQRFNSYMVLTRPDRSHIDLTMNGPRGFSNSNAIVLSLSRDDYKTYTLCTTDSGMHRISNDRNTRDFNCIYRIPTELFNEIKSLCQQ